MFLHQIEILRPQFQRSEKELLSWLIAQHRYRNNATAQKFLERLSKEGGPILSRGFEMEEYLIDDLERLELFHPEKNPHGPTLGRRTELFQKFVLDKFRLFYKNEVQPPNQLYHVSCTGYHSPSAAQVLVSEKNWGEKTTVTHLYHMGCYASIPAIRLALGNKTGQVDIVHTELCSLHLDPWQTGLEQLVVQSLFADGYAKYSISNLQGLGDGFEVLTTFEEVVPQSSEYMKWYTTEWGFFMALSKSVPALISKEMKKFVHTLLEKAGISSKENLAYAIHPGGARIIDEIKQTLELTEEQVAHSRQVLKECGNMSSATLPHIWKAMLLDPHLKDGTFVLNFAFGPGLTICGAVFKLRKKS